MSDKNHNILLKTVSLHCGKACESSRLWCQSLFVTTITMFRIWKSFSPLWGSMCMVKTFVSLNIVWQKSQYSFKNGFPQLWRSLWIFKTRVSLIISHNYYNVSHLEGFSPVCMSNMRLHVASSKKRIMAFHTWWQLSSIMEIRNSVQILMCFCILKLKMQFIHKKSLSPKW